MEKWEFKTTDGGPNPRTIVLAVRDTYEAAVRAAREFEGPRWPYGVFIVNVGAGDDLLARMQTPEAKAGMQAAFDADPAEVKASAARMREKYRASLEKLGEASDGVRSGRERLKL